MDEVLDYIKSAKTNRKYLVTALIASEILGIITFIWILKTPLYQKFFQFEPKAYSLNQMETQIRYLLAQNDYLQGTTKNSGKLIILLSNGTQVEEKGKIRANDEGQWYYQIPENTTPGSKLVTVAELDEINNILSIKSYKIRVKPNEIIQFGETKSNLEYPTVSIEDITPVVNTPEQTTPLPSIEISPSNPPQE
jgi:hypothetical protein